MKRFGFTLIICAFALETSAQVGTRFYYSRYWELTSIDSAVYYRDCVIDTTRFFFTGEVNDYDVSKTLMMKGVYAGGKKNGEFVFYYPNGQVESKGKFADDLRLGPWHYYYLSGQLRQMVIFAKDESHPAIDSYFDSVGNQLVKDGTGHWSEMYYVLGFPYPLTTQGNLVKFERDGDWTTARENGTILLEEKYKKGRFIRGKTYDTAGVFQGDLYVPVSNKVIVPYKLTTMESFKSVPGVGVEHYPMLRTFYLGQAKKLIGMLGVRPPARDEGVVYGDSKTRNLTGVVTLGEGDSPPKACANFMQGIADNLSGKYPALARRYGIEGRVFVDFVVETDGSISELAVLKGIGAGCDLEAIRVVRLTQLTCKWQPAMKGATPVRARMTVPIIFKLG